MEQTGAHLPPTPRLRVVDQQLQTIAPIRDVLYLPSQRRCARARHGDRDQEDPVRSRTTPISRGILNILCRMYLFTMQLAQIPLIAVGRMPVIKRNKLFGNIVFWLGLYAGFPLLCVAYCAY